MDILSLGRYPLSVILSYLTETEGTSLLITQKRYAYQLLPRFRVKINQFDGLSVRGGPKRRHRFVVSPVQDSVVLLDRLNTRKIYKRKYSIPSGQGTAQIAAQEWDNCSKSSLAVPPALGLLRFLDRTNDLRLHSGTLLVSYPRSGNTLMRTLLERVTGIVTGSDTRADRSLSLELAEQHDLVGEGVTQASHVAFVKTHWPERTGATVYAGARAVVLVRNPYDAMDSYWNLNATKSHTKTLDDEVYERFTDKFERLVRNEINVWLRFHDYWLNDTCKGIPVLVVRFEDLIQDPAGQLRRVLQFSLKQEQLSDFWERRIVYVTGSSSTDSGTEQLGSYRPRSSSTAQSIGKSIRKGRYSEALLDYIRETASNFPNNYLRQFGYDIKEQGFPYNSCQYTSTTNGSTIPKYGNKTSSLQVNVGAPVRPVNCEFGRAMQLWRHSVTDNDRNPLPTLTR
jgi:hypothetical protein